MTPLRSDRRKQRHALGQPILHVDICRLMHFRLRK